MKRQHVLNCAFSSWYPMFKQWTIKSKIVKLPTEFVEYLLQDGIVLPGSTTKKLLIVENSNNDDHETYDEWSDDEEDELESPKFPELETEINEAIKNLGGTVFPKLNWSAPRDASWISTNCTLKCSSFQDICLLLKSSDFIAHDLTQAFEHCEDSTDPQPKEDFELILRRWVEILPSMEFRCFVKKQKLIAISQRDHTHFYEYAVKNKDDIHKDITNFYKMKMLPVFTERSYIFDVYRHREGGIKLIDINPFSRVTDTLLFSWHEIQEDKVEVSGLHADVEGEFRLITDGENLQPSQYCSYGMPKDVGDIASGEDFNKLVEFFHEKQQKS